MTNIETQLSGYFLTPLPLLDPHLTSVYTKLYASIISTSTLYKQRFRGNFIFFYAVYIMYSRMSEKGKFLTRSKGE